MNTQSKIQKWGNSSAIRLPATALAAAGISPGSEVDIHADEGRLVIQLPERTKEQYFDKLLAEVPDAEATLASVQEGLNNAISVTNKTVEHIELLCEELQTKKGI